jgi:hypothetical protein
MLMRGGNAVGTAGLLLSVTPWAITGLMAWLKPD